MTIGQEEAHNFLGELSPIQKVRQWYEDAKSTMLMEPNAVNVCTVNKQGVPSSRIVLCKEFRNEGFVFFTNYNSRKALDIAENPNVALTFFWDPLKHQVKVRGTAEKLPAAESDAYWAKRPRQSQLAQSISRQSETVESRSVMEKDFQRAVEEFEGRDVPRPPHWGGFLVRPTYVEFWIGREARFHDRFAYHKVEGQWRGERLYP